MTDPIADLLIQIKNGYMSYKEELTIPSSLQKKRIAQLLEKEGYIGKADQIKTDKTKLFLKLKLVYKGKTPRFTNVVRISKPGRRVYAKADKIPTVLGGLGMVIVSTPKGVMTGKQAKKSKMGGELICKLW